MMEPLHIPTANDFLYVQMAARIEKQVKQNLLKPGDKLPSVRALSQEQGISLSTAFKTYTELETLGIIEARPKSGYYVRFRQARFSETPETKPPIKKIRQASVAQIIAMVDKNMHEEGVLRLSLSAPPINLIPVAKLSKSMAEAIRKSPNGNINYENVQGNISLRKQIARQAFSWGGNITEEDVVTTQGCIEALAFCLRAVTKPGDTVAIESPTYFGIFNIMLSLDLKVLEIPVHPDTGADIEYLKRAIDKVEIKACLFVNNFSNPVGSCMPDNRKKQLVQLLAKKKIPLIEDDIYGEIYFGKSRPRTCKSFDTKGGVMLCSSVSKSLAPGYRVGWCIPGKFKEQIIQIKRMHSVTSATPTQAAIAHFLETGRYDLHMRNLRRALYTQCQRYMRAISDYFPPDTKISQPQGGYVLWIELNKSINAFKLYQAALENAISIAPGQIFSTDSRFTNFIRISFGISFDDTVDKSIRILGNLVRHEARGTRHGARGVRREA
jgi:DNA-binding transcriptional MocR family regulator